MNSFQLQKKRLFWAYPSPLPSWAAPMSSPERQRRVERVSEGQLADLERAFGILEGDLPLA